MEFQKSFTPQPRSVVIIKLGEQLKVPISPEDMRYHLNCSLVKIIQKASL